MWHSRHHPFRFLRVPKGATSGSSQDADDADVDNAVVDEPDADDAVDDDAANRDADADHNDDGEAADHGDDGGNDLFDQDHMFFFDVFVSQ